ncbi:hypothetical protein D3Z39_11175 [Anaerotruncus colihominis]|uniref:Uncharacterized protein n=1 Tax=Anaerotruncus colihominis TaxID=169435 RepID=A0A845RI43_9FIRM|nr:hypothetical protein [Anaerotruncus colihominis]
MPLRAGVIRPPSPVVRRVCAGGSILTDRAACARLLLGRARGGNDAVRFFPRDYVARVRLYDARQFFAAVAAENGADTFNFLLEAI